MLDKMASEHQNKLIHTNKITFEDGME